MLPVKSNTADLGCTPVSSNCVVWQGPDIPAINLCTGDTVSSVVYKVAQDLTLIKSSFELKDLDLSILVDFCSSVGPAPTTKTLSAVLDFIIKKISCLNNIVETELGTSVTPPSEPPLPLPTCLSAGTNSVSLSNREFSLLLGNRFCEFKSKVDGDIISITNRIINLEDTPGITLPTVTPTCILPSNPTAMNVVLSELEKQFCQFRTSLGNTSQITAAAAQQCAGLSTANALGQPGIMSAYPGWVVTPTNMAQAFQNLWLTVCDLRAAVGALKDCCGKVDCNQVVIDCEVSTNSDRTIVTFDFKQGTVIPQGFINAVSGSTIRIKDKVTTKNFDNINLVDLATTGVFSAVVAGPTVEGAALNTSQQYDIEIISRVTKDGTFCTQTIPKTAGLSCPIITNVTATLVP